MVHLLQVAVRIISARTTQILQKYEIFWSKNTWNHGTFADGPLKSFRFVRFEGVHGSVQPVVHTFWLLKVAVRIISARTHILATQYCKNYGFSGPKTCGTTALSAPASTLIFSVWFEMYASERSERLSGGFLVTSLSQVFTWKRRIEDPSKF